MAEVLVKATIGASAADVWKTVSDFGGIAKLGGGVTSCTLEGEGVGSVRTITLGTGAVIKERLESCDEAAHSLSYSIIEAPLPLKDYVSTMKLTDAGDGQCELAWSSTFEPAGVPEAEAKKMVEGIYHMGIAGYQAAYA